MIWGKNFAAAGKIIGALLFSVSCTAATMAIDDSEPSPEKPVMPGLMLTPDYDYKEVGARTLRWKITATPDFPFDKCILTIRHSGLGSSCNLQDKPSYLYLCFPNSLTHEQATELSLRWEVHITGDHSSDWSDSGKEVKVPYGSTGLVTGISELTPDTSITLLEFYQPEWQKIRTYRSYGWAGWTLKQVIDSWQGASDRSICISLSIKEMTAKDFAGYQTPAEKRAWDRMKTLDAEKGLKLSPTDAATIRHLNLQLFSQSFLSLKLEEEYRSGLIALTPILECRELEIKQEQKKLRLLASYGLGDKWQKYADGLREELRKNAEKQLSLMQYKYDAGGATVSEFIPYKKKVAECSASEAK